MNDPLRRLLSLLTPVLWQMSLGVALGVLTIFCGIGLLTTSAYLISRAALQPSIAAIQVAIVGVRAFGIGRGVFRYLERVVSHEATFRTLANLRGWFYEKLEPLAPAAITKYRTGDLLNRFVDDIETLNTFYLRTVSPMIVAVVVVGMVGIFFAQFDLFISVVVVSLLVMTGFALPLLAWKLGAPANEQYILLRSRLRSASISLVQGTADLLIFDPTGNYIDQLEILSGEISQNEKHMSQVEASVQSLAILFMNLTPIVVLVMAIPLVRAGQLEGVLLAALVVAAISSYEAVLSLPEAFQSLQRNRSAAARAFEIADAEPEVCDLDRPAVHPAGFAISCRGLTFRYPGQHPYALQQVAFEIPEGGWLAVVGPTGSGKSTLVNLLMRFWEYSTGEIKLGGYDLKRLQLEDVRASIGLITQQPYIFGASLRNNLLLAQTDASEATLLHVLERVRLIELIHRLPDGLDTWVGERGWTLSAGERQRIAIARILLKNAPIMIMDEPTAHLDARTEVEVWNSLQKVMEGRTTLMVTHRLLGMDQMDHILVLEAGKVVEEGTHKELLSRRGVYESMWGSQSVTRGIEAMS